MKQFSQDGFQEMMLTFGFTPEQAAEMYNNPDAGVSAPNGSQNPCDRDRSERFRYMPTVQAATIAGDRETATGVAALLCPSDLKPPNSRGPRKGSWEPPGYVYEEQRGSMKVVFNRSHILGDRFHGDWIKENIFTGFKQMNDPDMKRCENRMAKQLKTGPVLYFGKLEYGNGRENIPTAIQMDAFTQKSRLFSVNAKNIPDPQVTC